MWPAYRDINIWRGNSFEMTFRLRTRLDAGPLPVDLSGSDIVFRATWPGGTLRRNAGAGIAITNAANGEFVLSLTASESRLLPVGNGASYEIERRLGTSQTTILHGSLLAAGGINDD